VYGALLSSCTQDKIISHPRKHDDFLLAPDVKLPCPSPINQRVPPRNLHVAAVLRRFVPKMLIVHDSNALGTGFRASLLLTPLPAKIRVGEVRFSLGRKAHPEHNHVREEKIKNSFATDRLCYGKYVKKKDATQKENITRRS